MSSELDQLTIAYEENGEVLVEELEKVVLQPGVWATLLFLYRERDRKTGQFKPPKAGLRRYRKVSGAYRKQDGINISAKTAPLLIEKLKQWYSL